MTNLKFDEKNHVRNQTVSSSFDLKFFPISFPFRHIMDTDLKFKSENIQYRCTSLAGLTIAAEQIEKMYIRHKIFY